MLEPEFLDTIIERFVKEDSVVAPDCREMPPFSNQLLAFIALIKIHKSATLEQIVLLLKFLFPALSGLEVMKIFQMSRQHFSGLV